mmetsp:Transcript_53663/g.73305  ORF Transcript_53663/g.73305 Transcript_53663/m.73305 type:complete len:289 (-) Transcript_53663:400-1266(-)
MSAHSHTMINKSSMASSESSLEKSTLKSAIDSFKSANILEIRSLCNRGHSRSAAISTLLERICGTKDDKRMVEENVKAEAHILGHKLGMAADDALHTLVVKREMSKLQERGFGNIDAIEHLTRRLQLSAGARDGADQNAGPLSSTLGSKRASGTAVVVQSQRKRSNISDYQVVPSSPMVSSLKRSTRRPNTKNPNAKKPAAAEDTVVSTDKDTEIEKDLARQLQGQVKALTAEINDAMRGGDRRSIALLMRQREQLRHQPKRARSLPPPTHCTGEAGQGVEPKRPRIV